jgi:EpsI family protein
MLAAATGALYSIDRGATGLLQDPKTFPFVIGTWTIDHQRDDELPVGLPDTDTSIVRSYRATDGRRVTLAVAYTKTQRQGKELVGLHTAPLHEKALPTVLQVGHQAPANRTIVEQGRRQIPAVFWYHIDGQSYADRSLTKLATIKQAFTRGRTDGALVMVFSNQQTNDREDTWKMQEDFAATVFPLLREYIP